MSNNNTIYVTYKERKYRVDRCTYMNGTLALEVFSKNGRSQFRLTVNLPDNIVPLIDTSCQFVDVNNVDIAEEFIEETELGIPVGITQRSGYVEYPLYKFDLSKTNEVKE